MKALRVLRKLLFSMSFLMLVSGASAQGAANRLSSGSRAIGLLLGDPMGLSGKYWLQDGHAVDMGLSLTSDNYVLVYSDYLFHFPGLFGSSSSFVQQLRPYFGLGGELSFARTANRVGSRYLSTSSASIGIGLRIPLGVEWMVPDAPFGVYTEVVPVFGIAPQYSSFEGGVGARWYF
jgi:hypothetical protein